MYLFTSDQSIDTYKSSTFFLAQGVLRKKVKLDLMLGLLIKQLIRMRSPSSSHPKWATSSVTINSNVLPWRGSFDWFIWLFFWIAVKSRTYAGTDFKSFCCFLYNWNEPIVYNKFMHKYFYLVVLSFSLFLHFFSICAVNN